MQSFGACVISALLLVHAPGCTDEQTEAPDTRGEPEFRKLSFSIDWSTDWKCDTIAPTPKYTVTVDNASDIITYADAGDYLIEVKPGIYYFNQTIVVRSNTILTAKDINSQPIFVWDDDNALAGSSFLDVKGAKQVEISYIQVDGVNTYTGSPGGNPAATGIGIDDSSLVLIDHTKVQYIFGSAYRVEGSTCIIERRNWASEIQYAGSCNPSAGEADGLNISKSERVWVEGCTSVHVERAGFIATDSSDLAFLRDSVGDIGGSCTNQGVGLAAKMAASQTSAPLNLLISTLTPLNSGTITGAGVYIDATSGSNSQIVGISGSDMLLTSNSTWEGIYLCGGSSASGSDIANTTVTNGDILASMTIPSSGTDTCTPAACSFGNPCSTSSLWW